MIVGIIAFNNLKYCPYISPYTHLLEKMNIKYNIIYFDRDGVNEKNEKVIPVSWNKGKSKIKNFISFSRIARKIIIQNKYDKLIILTTVPGVLLLPVLGHKYNKNYVIDIRDYTLEKYFIFRCLEKCLIKNATVRVISAPGFKRFLPAADYVLCHNTTYDFTKKISSIKMNETIVIGYVGTITYANQCKLLIDLVKNDSRFCFYFYGNDISGNQITQSIIDAHSDRIKYLGAYNPNDKDSIIKSVDILFNAYGNNSEKLLYAISNKFYDSIYYMKPVITSPNTEMSSLLDGFSYDIDKDTESLEGLYSWYHNIDYEKMNELINEWSEKISKEQSEFENTIKTKFLGV